MAANDGLIRAAHGQREQLKYGTNVPFCLLVLAVAWLLALGAHAATPSDAYLGATAWLELHQNADGSWGSGLASPVATAEALSALAAAGRGNGPAGRRARAWLVNHSYESLDHRARAVRALAAAGGVPAALADFDHPGGTPAATGWGPVAPDDGVTSYDSALVMAAIRASGDLGTDLSSPLAEVIARRRSDDGWCRSARLPFDTRTEAARSETVERGTLWLIMWAREPLSVRRRRADGRTEALDLRHRSSSRSSRLAPLDLCISEWL